MILALKTAGPITEAWLYKPGPSDKPVAELTWESGRELADQLLGRLNQFLTEHKIVPHALTGIIIFSGPGSFTSLRIGHTVANALADTLRVPIAGAQGDNWASAAMAILPDTPPGRPALPHYGSEAHVTRPKT